MASVNIKPRWPDEDWQALFDERAAILEYDGECSDLAERLAFWDTVEV